MNIRKGKIIMGRIKIYRKSKNAWGSLHGIQI